MKIKSDVLRSVGKRDALAELQSHPYAEFIRRFGVKMFFRSLFIMHKMNFLKDKNTFALCPLVLWILSLCLPAANWGSGSPVAGIFILLTGWAGFLNLQFAWLANVPFALTFYIIYNKIKSSYYFLFIFLVSIILPTLQSLFWSVVHTDQGSYPVHLGYGYYFWIASMVAQCLCLAFWPSGEA